ncbi:MAG: glycosyltransferase family 2 protein [Paracoccaceae bacterium]
MLPHPPLVSVIVPAFNAKDTLTETLRSVSAQTHAQLEILVVDDGSTDETAALAERIGLAEPRLSLIRQANSGVAAARNAGLARAQGDYVAWLDADDLWHPTKIAKQLDIFAAAKCPLGFVYTGYRLIDTEGIVIRNPRTLADVSGTTLCRQIATTYFTNVSSIMAPLPLAQELGGHDPRLRAWGIEGAEDLLLQLRLALRAPVGCVPEALVGYRMHGQNMSRSVARAARSNDKVLHLIAEAVPDIPPWVFRLGRARMAGFAFQIAQAGDLRGGAAFMAHLAADQPADVAAMLMRIIVWVLHEATGRRPAEPALGTRFDQADPATAPWEGHMLLSDRQRRRLDALDARRAALP